MHQPYRRWGYPLLAVLSTAIFGGCASYPRPREWRAELACDVHADCQLYDQLSCPGVRVASAGEDHAAAYEDPQCPFPEGTEFVAECVERQCRARPVRASRPALECRENFECVVLPGPCGQGQEAWPIATAEGQRAVLMSRADSPECAVALGTGLGSASRCAGEGERTVQCADWPSAACDDGRCVLIRPRERNQRLAQAHEQAVQLCEQGVQELMPDVVSAVASYERRVEALKATLQRTDELWIDGGRFGANGCLSVRMNEGGETGQLRAGEGAGARDWVVHFGHVLWASRVRQTGELGQEQRVRLGMYAGQSEQGLVLRERHARPVCVHETYTWSTLRNGERCECEAERLHYSASVLRFPRAPNQAPTTCPPCPAEPGCDALGPCLSERIRDDFPPVPEAQANGLATLFFTRSACER